MIDHEKVLAFISRFHGSEHVFLHGCCYWFAHILETRFLSTGAVTIMHDPVEGHFITRIGNRYYDVRGDVTELYRGKPMYDMDELDWNDAQEIMYAIDHAESNLLQCGIPFTAAYRFHGKNTSNKARRNAALRRKLGLKTKEEGGDGNGCVDTD